MAVTVQTLPVHHKASEVLLKFFYLHVFLILRNRCHEQTIFYPWPMKLIFVSLALQLQFSPVIKSFWELQVQIAVWRSFNWRSWYNLLCLISARLETFPRLPAFSLLVHWAVAPFNAEGSRIGWNFFLCRSAHKLYPYRIGTGKMQHKKFASQWTWTGMHFPWTPLGERKNFKAKLTAQRRWCNSFWWYFSVTTYLRLAVLDDLWWTNGL